MSKILNINQAIRISRKIHDQNKTVVLTGGCFDILHIGHIQFLKNAKKNGDYLFVLLESDETVRKLKGSKRPINNQKDRAQILSAVKYMDYVVLLPQMNFNKDYDDLVYKLSPNIIAVTQNSPQIVHNLRQAKKINAKVLQVTKKIEDKSTTNLAKLIAQNF